MFSIIGIVVVFGCVVAGYLMEHGNLKVLIQPAELVTILGAAVGTVLFANPLYILIKIGKGIGAAFGGSQFTKQRYLGGLLHDIGMLPLLVIAAKEQAFRGDTSSGPWGGSMEAEKTYFGLNHCEVGRWIGQSWNFFPSFIDVFENHHHPERSTRDPHLVGIVSAADHFCETHSMTPPSDAEPQESLDPIPEDEWLAVCFPRLDANERSELTEMVETEYLHLLPVIEFNNPAEHSMPGKTS